MIGAVLDAGLPVTGHWSLHGWTDHRLHAYAAAGVDSRPRDRPQARTRWPSSAPACGSSSARAAPGTTSPSARRVLTEDGVDSRHALLVTDDMHPETLARERPPRPRRPAPRSTRASTRCSRIQLATVNAAEYLGRRHDLGSIAPGRRADILLVEDLTRPPPAPRDRRRPPGSTPAPSCPASTRRAAFRTDRPPARARSPRTTCASTRRRARHARPSARSAWSRASSRPSTASSRRPVNGGAVAAAPDLDVAQGGEHRAPRRPGHDRPRLRPGARASQRGAVATTVAHDNHNLFVVGTNDADMLVAVAAPGRGRRRHDRGRGRRRRRRSSSCRSPACCPTAPSARSPSRSARSTAPTPTWGRRSSTRS